MSFFLSVLTSGSSWSLCCCANSWGWKAPLENLWSNCFTQAGSARSVCPQLCPVGFRRSPRMQSLQLSWATYSSVQPPSHLLYCCYFSPFDSAIGSLNHLCWTVPSALAISNTCTSPSSGPPHARKLWAKPEQVVIPPQDNIPRKFFFLVQLECMLWPVRQQNLFYIRRAIKPFWVNFTEQNEQLISTWKGQHNLLSVASCETSYLFSTVF